jgi:hypothetical protein
LPEPRPIARKVIAGAVLLGGAVIALVTLRAKNTPLVVEAGAPPVVETVAPQASLARTPEPTAAPAPSITTSGTPLDLGSAIVETKKLDEARTALAKGDAKSALAALDSYDKIAVGTHTAALQHEATLLRIQAYAKVGRKTDARIGRKTDARALAMSVRDEPDWEPDTERLDAIMSDAGI